MDTDRLNPCPALAPRDAVAALLLIAVTLAAGALRMAPGVCGVFHDDGIYVSTAQSLSEGAGYRLGNLPGAPAQTKYPVLYPLLLSVVFRTGAPMTQNLLNLQVATLLSGAAAVSLAYLHLVRWRYTSRPTAFVACLLCGTSPYLLYLATLTLSEMPFALLLALAAWSIERTRRAARPTRTQCLLSGVALALPFLCRTIGAPLIPAGLWLAGRDRRRLFWMSSGAGMVALPWLLWSRGAVGLWQQAPVEGYYTDYAGWWASVGLPSLGAVLAANAVSVVRGAGWAGLEGLWTDLFSVGPLLAHAAMFTLGLVSLAALLRGALQRRCLPVLLCAYLLPVLVWPWPPSRFLIPILPFLLAFTLQALVSAVRIGVGRRVGWWACTAVTAAALTANLALLVEHFRLTRATGYPNASLPDEPVRWATFDEGFRWLRENTRTDDTIASGVDTMVHLYTGRRAIRPFVAEPVPLFYTRGHSPLGSAEQLHRALVEQRVSYLLSAPLPGFAEAEPFARLLRELRALRPELLQPVFTSSDRRLVIYRVCGAASNVAQNLPRAAGAASGL